MLPKVEIKKRQTAEKYKISNFIPQILEKYSKIKPQTSSKILDIYEKAVGKEIASITSIIKFQDGELTVKTKSSVWKNELSFRENEIKKLINSDKNKFFIVKKIIFW